MSEYLGEFRTEWRAVTSAMVGLSSGLIMNSYAAGIMGPHLVAAFHWSKSELAAVQILALIAVFAFPFVGRLADVVGSRRTALVGIVASPLLFFAFTMVTSITTYAAIFALQVLFLTTTTPPIYCRVIVQYFKKARGLALALAASGPSAVAAIGGPLLNNLVVAKGWQAGYLALMVFAIVGGLSAYLLMPRELRESGQPARKQAAREDYRMILHAPAFWLLVVSMLLCNLPQAVILTQLNLMIAEHNVVGRSASIMVSAYAVGMLIGRFISGYALDRFPARLVATIGLSISAFGLLAMGLQGGSIVGLALAVLAIGLSFGAESDILAYLIYRQFGVRVYSTVHGMLAATVAIASALGAGALSYILYLTDSYKPFLLITGVAVLTGGLLLLLLPRGVEEDA
ncbi:Sugar phosphate permease [Novosphingobium sp. CF614]|uniref:MFS transporter n=1 Tax=Novosphingobium sp. CF614 TaxID=1884364 RepID=UPI0008E7FB78|nr:MFS transporter [Novosphingobium sp. CF614]SFF96437.1 Sugar phosphate permease [Novosphingobium sp. CF614]